MVRVATSSKFKPTGSISVFARSDGVTVVSDRPQLRLATSGASREQELYRAILSCLPGQADARQADTAHVADVLRRVAGSGVDKSGRSRAAELPWKEPDTLFDSAVQSALLREEATQVARPPLPSASAVRTHIQGNGMASTKMAPTTGRPYAHPSEASIASILTEDASPVTPFGAAGTRAPDPSLLERLQWVEGRQGHRALVELAAAAAGAHKKGWQNIQDWRTELLSAQVLLDDPDLPPATPAGSEVKYIPRPVNRAQLGLRTKTASELATHKVRNGFMDIYKPTYQPPPTRRKTTTAQPASAAQMPPWGAGAPRSPSTGSASLPSRHSLVESQQPARSPRSPKNPRLRLQPDASPALDNQAAAGSPVDPEAAAWRQAFLLEQLQRLREQMLLKQAQGSGCDTCADDAGAVVSPATAAESQPGQQQAVAAPQLPPLVEQEELTTPVASPVVAAGQPVDPSFMLGTDEDASRVIGDLSESKELEAQQSKCSTATKDDQRSLRGRSLRSSASGDTNSTDSVTPGPKNAGCRAMGTPRGHRFGQRQPRRVRFRAMTSNDSLATTVDVSASHTRVDDICSSGLHQKTEANISSMRRQSPEGGGKDDRQKLAGTDLDKAGFVVRPLTPQRARWTDRASPLGSGGGWWIQSKAGKPLPGPRQPRRPHPKQSTAEVLPTLCPVDGDLKTELQRPLSGASQASCSSRCTGPRPRSAGVESIPDPMEEGQLVIVPLIGRAQKRMVDQHLAAAFLHALDARAPGATRQTSVTTTTSELSLGHATYISHDSGSDLLLRGRRGTLVENYCADIHHAEFPVQDVASAGGLVEPVEYAASSSDGCNADTSIVLSSQAASLVDEEIEMAADGAALAVSAASISAEAMPYLFYTQDAVQHFRQGRNAAKLRNISSAILLHI
eukprot:TRINITY_DN11221_c0_g1_i2.p1 TRINITY_DN11221_c0_g1~~TRINITY_DN11221_c0_g1_i2.p1  ORF type:complete len:906 (-),score=125.29 TRINITY_DN11221_c0_g1_i2:451-3168(-)